MYFEELIPFIFTPDGVYSSILSSYSPIIFLNKERFFRFNSTVIPFLGIIIGPKLSSFQSNGILFGKKASFGTFILFILHTTLSIPGSFLKVSASPKVKVISFFNSSISLTLSPVLYITLLGSPLLSVITLKSSRVLPFLPII